MTTETNPTLHKWEKIDDRTIRLAVPGGWLYRHSIMGLDPYSGSEFTKHAMMERVPDPTAPHVIAAARRVEREAQRVLDRQRAEDAARLKADNDHADRVRDGVHAYLKANWTHQDGGVYALPASDGRRWICETDYSRARIKLLAPDGSRSVFADLHWSGICIGDVDHPTIAPIVAIIRGATP